MNPLPILRTEFQVLRIYVRKFPTQIGVILMTAVLLFLATVLLTFTGPILFGLTVLAKGIGLVVGLLTIGLLYLMVITTLMAMMIRKADQAILGSGPPDVTIPVTRLLKASLFMFMVIGGGYAVTAALLYALPWRMESTFGISEDLASLIIIGAMTLLYFVLALRLSLMFTLMCMDDYNVGAAWQMVIRVTTGKSVPLLFAWVFQVLVSVPIAAAFYFVLGVILPQGIQSVDGLAFGSQLPLIAAVMVYYSLQLSIYSALQAGVVRHFLGYHGGEDYSAEPMVVDENGNSPYREEHAPAVYQEYSTNTPTYFDPSALESDTHSNVGVPQAVTPHKSWAPPAPTAPTMPTAPPVSQSSDSDDPFADLHVPKPTAPPAPRVMKDDDEDPFAGL